MTGSESIKREIVKFGIPEKNITIVPHGIIVKNPIPMPTKERIPAIIYLGVLSKDKGIEEALKSFKLLSRKDQFQFWVVGKAETERYFKKVKSLISELELIAKVKLWGYVSQERKFELLAKAHVLVNPSIREGWGLVNIEANAMGTPVVVYDSPGLIDSVKDGVNGLICKKNSSKEMAEEVFNLLNNRELYKKLQNSAVSWSKMFDWKSSVKRGLTLIDSIARFGKNE